MPAGADTVTLNSGEVLEGRILSETDTQLVIEASFYHGTVLSTREVARSDIRSIVRESVEQQREKADFDALAKYTLNPSQELTRGQYAAGIAAFQKFLATCTNSSFAAEVNKRLADWRAEAANVEGGKVKYAGTWMTPDQKKTQVGQAALLSLQKLLVDLRAQRVAQSVKLSALQKHLADAQSRLASLQGSAGSAPGSSGRRDLAGRLTAGVAGASPREGAEEPASNPELSQVQDEINTLRQQISQQQSTLASLNAKIADLQSQIPMPPPQSGASVAVGPPPKSARSSGTNAPAATAPPAPDSEPVPPL
jgi:septal ring factor EnvC (AmiA/AmiB activator)